MLPISNTVIKNCIPRFGTQGIITAGQESQFDSQLFQVMSSLIAFKKTGVQLKTLSQMGVLRGGIMPIYHITLNLAH